MLTIRYTCVLCGAERLEHDPDEEGEPGAEVFSEKDLCGPCEVRLEERFDQGDRDVAGTLAEPLGAYWRATVRAFEKIMDPDVRDVIGSGPILSAINSSALNDQVVAALTRIGRPVCLQRPEMPGDFEGDYLIFGAPVIEDGRHVVAVPHQAGIMDVALTQGVVSALDYDPHGAEIVRP